MKLISRERFWSARATPGSLLSSSQNSSTISDLRISPSTLSGLRSIALGYRLLLRSSIELNNVSFISCCGILIVVVFWLLLYFDCCFRQTSMRCKHLGHFWLSFLNFFPFSLLWTVVPLTISCACMKGILAPFCQQKFSLFVHVLCSLVVFWDFITSAAYAMLYCYIWPLNAAFLGVFIPMY